MKRLASSRTSRRLARRYGELSLAAPAVIATRTLRMLAAGASPTLSDRREFARMHYEKAHAFSSAWFAMLLEVQRVQLSWWLNPMHFPWLAWHGVLDRGLAPIHRTALANARRLHRR
jgi:hypothetical protein